MARLHWLFAAAVATTLLAGCLDPYRPHVDPAVLARSAYHWTEAQQAQQDSGWFGTKQVETDYDVTASNGGAPPAHLEVFGLRSPADPGSALLLNRSQQELLAYAQRVGLTIDHSKDQSGTRRLATGLDTSWFTTEGKAGSNGVFTRNYRVRLVAEVGHDGRSSTSLVMLGVAQVETSRECPVFGDCGPTSDERTWIEMAGDGSGQLAGAQTANGLMDHVVSA